MPQDCECQPGPGGDDHPVDHIPGVGNVSRGGSLPNPLNLPGAANSAGGRSSMSSQVRNNKVSFLTGRWIRIARFFPGTTYQNVKNIYQMVT
jgi:hypothetical protein